MIGPLTPSTQRLLVNLARGALAALAALAVCYFWDDPHELENREIVLWSLFGVVAFLANQFGTKQRNN